MFLLSLFLIKKKSVVQFYHLVTVSLLAPTKPSRKYVSFRDTRDHRKIDMDAKSRLWEWTRKLNYDDPEECVIKNELWAMFESFCPLIKVKISSRDPPYMSPLLSTFAMSETRLHATVVRKKLVWQERINSLICMNQVRAEKDQMKKHAKGSKGWWDIANRITRRKAQGIPIRSVFFSDDINSYF